LEPNFDKIVIEWSFSKIRRYLWEFPIGSYVKLSSAVAAISVGNARHNFGRGPPKDHFSKVWLRLAQGFSRKKYLGEVGTLSIIWGTTTRILNIFGVQQNLI
jgi:hypothetical protein